MEEEDGWREGERRRRWKEKMEDDDDDDATLFSPSAPKAISFGEAAVGCVCGYSCSRAVFVASGVLEASVGDERTEQPLFVCVVTDEDEEKRKRGSCCPMFSNITFLSFFSPIALMRKGGRVRRGKSVKKKTGTRGCEVLWMKS